MRDEQRLACEKMVDCFTNGGEEFLLGAKMRFGKNFTLLNAIKEMDFKNTLVLTYKPHVFNSLKEDIENHVNFENMEIIDLKDQRTATTNTNSKNRIYLASAQLVLYLSEDKKDEKTVEEKIRKMLKTVSNLNLDLIVVDEYHYGCETYNFQNILNNLQYKHICYVSGTPFKDVVRQKFTEEQSYFWSYIDEQRVKRQEKLLGYGSHLNMPTMELRLIRISEDAKLQEAFYTEEEGFNMRKLLTMENGKLKDEGSAELLLKAIIGIHGRKTLSPFRIIPNLEHTVWFLDKNVEGIKALAKIMERIPQYEGYDIIIATGNEVTDIRKVKETINKAKGNKRGTITLSCQRFKEGVTVPEWNAVLMLDSGKSPEEYFQAIFRCQNPGDDKDKCYVFDFNPSRCLELIYGVCEYSDKLDNDNKTIKDIIREFLEYCPILDSIDNKWKLVEVDEVIKTFQQNTNFKDRFASMPLDRKVICNGELLSSLSNVKGSYSATKTKEVNKNFIQDGKTSKIVTDEKGNVTIYDENGDKKEILQITKLINKIRNCLSKIPEFVFITPEKERTLQDILNTKETELFEEITEISIEDFKLWTNLNLFDKLIFNRIMLNFSDILDEFYANISSESYEKFAKERLNLKGLYCKTPLVVIDRQIELSNIDFSNPNQKILDPCCGTGSYLLRLIELFMEGLKEVIKNEEKRRRHIIENMLYGWDISVVKVKMCKRLLNLSNYKHNIRILDANKINTKQGEMIDMKFDLIISNPPYTGSKDLKILRNIYNLSDKICFIHPSVWLYENKRINPTFNTMREIVKENLIYYEPIKNSNELFNISMFSFIMITLFNKNKKGMGENIYNIDIHGNDILYNSAKNKILNYCKFNNCWSIKNNDAKYKVGYSEIRGNVNSYDFFTIIQLKNEKIHIGEHVKYNLYNAFDTVEEMNNFLKYLKLKISRFCLSIYKLTGNLGFGELASVPYMPTYEYEWTDEMVAKELGLTDEELYWAINWIPDYYSDDAERYEKYFDPIQKERQRLSKPGKFGGYKMKIKKGILKDHVCSLHTTRIYGSNPKLIEFNEQLNLKNKGFRIDIQKDNVSYILVRDEGLSGILSGLKDFFEYTIEYEENIKNEICQELNQINTNKDLILLLNDYKKHGVEIHINCFEL